MWFTRMSLEEWFDKYQYEVKIDIGESAVKFLTFEDLGIELGRLPIRYGYHTGRPDLREVLAEMYPGFTADDILVTSGASEANFAIVAALARPGDRIVVEHPNYTSNYEVPLSLGCEVDLLRLKFEDGFKPDRDELRRLITPGTKLVSLTHPNNPTGSMITETELGEIIDIIEEKGTYLLFDETYRDMAFENVLPPACTLSDRVVSISSMSKVYGLPGIRTGWLATRSREILEGVLAVREQVSITNNAISEEIAVRVLARREEYLNRARKHIAANRDIVAAWIDSQDDVEWVYPEAGVVSLPRLRDHLKFDPEKLYTRLAETYKTFSIPGRCFEMDNRFFRLGFGANPEEIKQGLANLGQAIADLS